MSSLLLFRALPAFSALVCLVGLAFRAAGWWRAPAPAARPRDSVPASAASPGAALTSSAAEVFFFSGLWRSDRWHWLGAWPLHACLVLVALRHLRYFLYPVPGWLTACQTAGLWAGCLLPVALLYLLARRLLIDHAVQASSAADYLALLLLLAIAGTGVAMRLVWRQDVLAVKDMALAYASLRLPASAPAGSLFAAHFLLVNALVAYLPFSRLLHAPGVSLGLAWRRREGAQPRLCLAPRGGQAGEPAAETGLEGCP